MGNNKREEYCTDQTDQQFYGPFYKRSLTEKRVVLYQYKDITIEEPILADARHIYKCYMDDAGLTEADFNTDKRKDTFKIMRELRWLYSKHGQNEKTTFMFRDNEFVGYGTYIDSEGEEIGNRKRKPTTILSGQINSGMYGRKVPIISTRMRIRKKFRKTLCPVCAIDYITNVVSPDLVVLTDNKNIYQLLQASRGRTKNMPRLADESLHKKKYQVHKILQNDMMKTKVKNVN